MKVLPKLKDQRRWMKYDNRIEGNCPKCGHYITSFEWDERIVKQGFTFCPKCGQKIDITEE